MMAGELGFLMVDVQYTPGAMRLKTVVRRAHNLPVSVLENISKLGHIGQLVMKSNLTNANFFLKIFSSSSHYFMGLMVKLSRLKKLNS